MYGDRRTASGSHPYRNENTRGGPSHSGYGHRSAPQYDQNERQYGRQERQYGQQERQYGHTQGRSYGQERYGQKNTMSYVQRYPRPPPGPDGSDPGFVAVNNLRGRTKDRMLALFDDGTLRKGDLDPRAVMTLFALPEEQQTRVVDFLEDQRLFLGNSKSKAGFLVAACERAKRGELNVMGFGSVDPFKRALAVREGVYVEDSVPVNEQFDPRKSMNLTVAFNGHDTTLSAQAGELVSAVVNRAISCFKIEGYLRYRLVWTLPDRAPFQKWAGKLLGLRSDRPLGYYGVDSGDLVTMKFRARHRKPKEYVGRPID